MRYYLDFGSSNGNLTPPVFGWFRDASTHAAIAPPAIFASAAPSWTYYFDFTFPPASSPTTTAIDYGVTLGSVGLTDVISNAPVSPSQAQPLSNTGAGGVQTLSQLRDLIRSESDTENDPHITDAELTTWINQSRLRLYDKVIAAFGEDYYTAQATITTDGVNTQFQLPDGIAYSSAPPFYKGQMLEVVSGGGVSANAPVTLDRFNLREKNRYQVPFSLGPSPTTLPRYRIMGSNPGNIVFTAAVAGLVCKLWYAPKLTALVNDADVADDFCGWSELVVVDCVIKALGKQERDAGLAITRKAELIADIERAVANRDIGEPNVVVTTDDLDIYGGDLWS